MTQGYTMSQQLKSFFCSMIDTWNILHCLQALVEAVRLLSASHCARMNRAPSTRERRSHAEEENCIWAACK